MNKPINQKIKVFSTTAFRALIAGLFVFSASLHADEAAIVEAKIQATGGENMFRIDVTIKHADAGWDHYANQWDILDENGDLLGSRVLHHPHDNEQPFTRSLSLMIPASVTMVTIVAHDSVHKDNPETMALAVPGRQ